jgi:hypothetical protein
VTRDSRPAAQRQELRCLGLLIAASGLALIAAFACRPRDILSPTVRFLFPTNGDTVIRGTVQLKILAQDNQGIERVDVYVDSAFDSTTRDGTADTFRYFWHAHSESLNAFHTLAARPFDAAGNSAEAAIRVFVIPDTWATHHGGEILSDETWRARDNPHVIDYDVSVRNATLTIEPGCRVQLEPGSWLYCGYVDPGAIVADGRPDSLIVFTSRRWSPKPGDWQSIGIYDYALPTTSFRYCRFEYGGPSGSSTIVVSNAGMHFNHCRILASGGFGIDCRNGGWFRSCTSNVVTAGPWYPVRIGPQQAGTLGPGDSLNGNQIDAVEVTGGEVKGEAVWPKLSVPYVVSGDITIASDTSLALLTVAPGCSVLLAGTGFYVGPNSPGALVADGRSQTITFTGRNSEPEPGAWKSIWFAEHAIDSLCRLQGCRLEYGGAWDSANVRIQDARPEISGDSIGYSPAYGIFVGGTVYPVPESLAARNIFYHDSLGPVNRP